MGGGAISRMFVGLTHGYFKKGEMTIEDVEENVEAIRDEEGYLVPFSIQDELAKLGPKLAE